MPEQDPPSADNEPTQAFDPELDEPRRATSRGYRQRLGDFELLREIGRGGMGVVYEARQVSLNRRVALKVLPPGLGLSREAKTRFEREARAAAKLHHTNIVPVHAIGEQDGHHFYAMELIEGQALDALLDQMRGGSRDPGNDKTETLAGSYFEAAATTSSTTDSVATTSAGRQWFDAVARLLAEVAEALDYAHSKGVIHRDIKPANLLFDADERLCVADFGLARLAQEPGVTMSGSLLGTPAYMSPEQISGRREKLDHRTDIYSLGVVLYEMLTLRRPFPGQSQEQILHEVLTDEPPAPRRLNRRVPQDLETVCLKAMEKDPSRRYASAGEVAHDLRQYLAHGLITARRAGPIRRTSKWIMRHPVSSTAALAAFMLIVAAAVVGWTWGERSAEAAQRLVAEAQFLMERGDPQSAIEKADAALAANPDAVEARRIRALALVGLYEWLEAVEEARRLLEQDDRDRTAHRVMILATMNVDLQVASINLEDHLAALSDGPPDTADVLYAKAELASSTEEKMELLNGALEREPDHWLALKRRQALFRDRKDFTAAWRDVERMEVAVPWFFWGRIGKVELYFEQRNPVSALREADRVTELHPEDHAGYCFKSLALRSLGRFEEELVAVTRSNELLELATHSWFLSDIHYRLGNYERTVVDAKKAIELKPDLIGGAESLIRAYLALGKRIEARATLERMLIEAQEWANPELRIEACVVATDCLAELGEMDEALVQADKIGEIDPASARRFVERARVLRRFLGVEATATDCTRLAELSTDGLAETGSVLDTWVDRGNQLRDTCQRHDLALAEYDRAIEAVPQWVDPYRERATVRRLQGDLAASLSELEKAIELQPNWLDLYHDRGRVYLELERFEEALADFQRYLDLGAESADLRWNQAQALLRLGRGGDGIRILGEAIKRRPKVDFLRNRLGEALLWLGRADEALDAHEGAVRFQPAQASGYAGRATARLLAGGSCTDVRSDLQRALELAPHDAEIRSRVAWAQVAYGQVVCPGAFEPSRAVELARQAVAYDPRNPDYLRALGMALYQVGPSEEARDTFLRSLELTAHGDPFSLFGLAMTQEALGNTSAARQAHERARERALRTFPKHSGMGLVLRESEALLGL